MAIQSLFPNMTLNQTYFEKSENVPDYISEAISLLFGVILLEAFLAPFNGYQRLRLNDSMSSVGAGVMQQLTKIATFSLELYLYTWVYTNWRVLDLRDSAFTWWTGFFIMDFFYYWFHRASHEVNIMWAAHQVHHSSEEYNLTTSWRQSVVQLLLSNLVYTAMGFFVPPSVFLVHVQLNFLYQFLIHTELIGSLGPLEYVLNTPSHHRVHHGRNPYCIDVNYGGILIIWDRLFGTFQDETDEKVVYGLVYRVNSWNPIYIQFGHYYAIVERFWETDGLLNKLLVLIYGPSWSPGKPRLGNVCDRLKVDNSVQKYDVSLPIWGNIYVIVHMIIFAIAFLELTTIHSKLDQSMVFCVAIFMFFTMTCFGLFMDNKWYSPYLECFRCSFFVVVDYCLTTWQHSFCVLPSSVLGATRVIYATSALLWFLLCMRPEKVFVKNV